MSKASTMDLGKTPAVLHGWNISGLLEEERDHGGLRALSSDKDAGSATEDKDIFPQDRHLRGTIAERVRASCENEKWSLRAKEDIPAEPLQEVSSDFILLSGGGSNFARPVGPSEVVDDHDPDDWEGVMVSAAEPAEPR